MLLQAQFESPVRETRARTELLHLHQRKGENACTYMARTKSLLHKVPGYDMKTALQQWLFGLRQPYRLEAAKAFPKDLSEAERIVARLEDAMEFSQAGREESVKGKSIRGNGNGDQRRSQNAEFQRRAQRSKYFAPRSGYQRSRVPQETRHTVPNSGPGSTSLYSRPLQPNVVSNYPHHKSAGRSRQCGQGSRSLGRPRLAIMTANDGSRVWADQFDREAAQHAARSEPDASLCQRQGN